MAESDGKSTHWGVLGGGMLGLTLAYRLAQAGRRVTLVEAAPSLGGLVTSWRIGDVTWDRYYHVTLLSDRHLRSLLSELELETELQWGVTRTNFYCSQGMFPLNDVIDYLKLPALKMIDKLRLAMTIVYASRVNSGLALEKKTVESWLVQMSGRRTYEQLWRPLLRAKLGDNHARASAAYIWSVIRRFYAARRGGLKTEMFGYVPGGYARVLDTFAERVRQSGVTVRAGCAVRSIHRLGPDLEVTTSHGILRFDRAIATFAAPIAARLCPDLTEAERACLSGVHYQGIICASVLLRRPLGGAYLTYITDETIPFTTVIEMSTLVDRNQLGGYHLAYLPKYVPSYDPMFEVSDEDIEKEFRNALVRLFPDLVAEDIVAFQLTRTRYVMAIPTLDYSASIPSLMTSVPGLHIVNSAQIVNASLSVNETVALADSAAGQLLERETVS